MIINANEIKTKGVSIFANLLEKFDELIINVRGKNQYVVLDIERYKELRRSGRNTHEKGGGIGFYEIAKRCDKLEFDFKEINSDKYYFHVKTTISNKKGE